MFPSCFVVVCTLVSSIKGVPTTPVIGQVESPVSIHIAFLSTSQRGLPKVNWEASNSLLKATLRQQGLSSTTCTYDSRVYCTAAIRGGDTIPSTRGPV